MSHPPTTSAATTGLRRTIFLTMTVAVVGLVQQLVDDFLHPTASQSTPIEIIDWITVTPTGDYTLTQIATTPADLDAEIKRLNALPNTIQAQQGGAATTTITIHQDPAQPVHYCALQTAEDTTHLDYLGE